ncbi:MAG TPA: substrate-binding domain-containing protein [Candidatus Limnocylindrales bacterium]|nr:substrate-binding domain-containing protein [Candidatus Limnocylindrales bacterium]
MKTKNKKKLNPVGILMVVILLPLLAPKAWTVEEWINQNLQGPAKGGFRVCADPDNLPYSNQKLEGFENKIAELMAKELGESPTYYWWPQRRGFIRTTLGTKMCDIVMGIPKGYDPVLWTKPYYRTSYVIAYPKNKGFQIKSLDDPILKEVKIGVYVNTPPHIALSERGITKNVVGYEVFYDPQENYPGKIIDDLAAGKLDVAIVWGAIAGYFAKKQPIPIEIVPLLDGGPDSQPFVYDISIGVRKSDKELKAKLEEILDKKKTEIRKILEDYGVPLIDGKENTQ